MAGPRDPYELMEPPPVDPLLPAFGPWVWVAAAAALLAAAGLAIFLLRRRAARGGTADSMKQAAYRDALAALDDMTGASAREAAVRCSLVLRNYLVKALSDPALFETHEEFVARHDALQGLEPAARESARRCFANLSQAKYAPEGPARTPGEIVDESRGLLETLHRGLAA